jgi:homoserine kinase
MASVGRRVKVRTPATSANLGPGFDVLGLALGIHNTIELGESGQGMTLTVSGEGKELLDLEPDSNLVLRSIHRFYEHGGIRLPGLIVHTDNGIPLARGLGSSAATIVGALAAANHFSGAGLGRQELFDLAVEIEGHADNVAAAVYGGFTIAYPQGKGYAVERTKPSAAIGVVLLVPEIGLSTAKARGVLPPSVDREQAVFNISRVALLVQAFTTGNLSLLERAVEDALHQPSRRGLIKDYDETVKACSQAGAPAVAISGAGPTLIAFYDRRLQETLRSDLPQALASRQINRRALFPEIDQDGVQVV